MALEEITTEMDVQKPAKTKDKQGPKKPLASMKKKYVKGVEVMDTELRSNVPVKQVKKESQDFADAMEKARKMTALEIAAKDKPKIKVMKKLGKAAGKAVHELPHDEKPVVNEMMKQKAIMERELPKSEPKFESIKPHIMEEINLDLPKQTERPKYEPLVREEQNRQMEEDFSRMRENDARLEKDLAENRKKIKSLKKPKIKKDQNKLGLQIYVPFFELTSLKKGGFFVYVNDVL